MSLLNFKEGYLPVEGHQSIYWCSYGNPNGVPLLLIHGGSGHTFDLESLTAFSQDDHHIITFHQRGFGCSKAFDFENAPNTVFSHVHDIEKLRCHLNIDQWQIFSWSFGAIFMTAYGCLNPDKCLGFSAYAPFLGEEEDWDVFLDSSPETARAYLEYYNSNNIRGAKKEAFQRMFAQEESLFLKGEFEKAKIFGYKGTETSFYESKSDLEWREELSKTYLAEQLYNEVMNKLPKRWLFNLSHDNPEFQSIPTTFYFGSDDQWVAPNTNIWFVYPISQQIMINGGGHDVHDQNIQTRMACQSMVRQVCYHNDI